MSSILSNIKTIFRLWHQYAKMDLLWLLRDTRYCLIQIFSDAVTALASVSAVLLISRKFGGIAGMSFEEMLFLCGFAVLIDGFILLFFGGNNIAYISRIIGRGQLDHMLIQPVPLWIQLLTGGFMPFSGSSKLLCGIVLTVISLRRLAFTVMPLWVLWLILNILCSAAIILSFVYVFSCCAFYAPVAAEEIAMVIHDLFSDTKTYPLAGLTKRGATVFCSILPVGLATWFPAEMMLGKTPAGLPGITFYLAAALWCAAAVLLFRKGLIHYGKYSSNRYTGFGHR